MEQSTTIAVVKDDNQLQSDSLTKLLLTLFTSEIILAIKQKPIDPESEACDGTISISSSSTANHFDWCGVIEAFDMLAFHYQQLTGGY